MEEFSGSIGGEEFGLIAFHRENSNEILFARTERLTAEQQAILKSEKGAKCSFKFTREWGCQNIVKISGEIQIC